MKKILLFTTLFAIVLALAFCSKERGLLSPEETSSITFNISAPTPSAKQTKAVNITRYIMEVYKESDLNTVVKREEQASGTMIVSLEANTNYVCLFWADGVALNDNTNGVYNATDLKNVTLNSNKEMEEAFFGRLDITDATTTFNLTLKRPTAQVNLVETGVLIANTNLAITYDQYNSFNTYSSAVTGAAVSMTKTFNSATTTGTMGTLLSFASVIGIVANITVVYNATITNNSPTVPLKANYITNLHGNYTTGDQGFTFNIVADEIWESVVAGVEINVGTTSSPIWIMVADRNADKNGTNGAAAGNSATDYGYYYAFSNLTSDPTNADKAYRACFDFAEGNGVWRLPTQAELAIISGDAGSSHNVNANRKLKWDGATWKLYSDRSGQTSNFVFFPMGGINNISSSNAANFGQGVEAAYWSSIATERLAIFSSSTSVVSSVTGLELWGFSVRCVRNI